MYWIGVERSNTKSDEVDGTLYWYIFGAHVLESRPSPVGVARPPLVLLLPGWHPRKSFRDRAWCVCVCELTKLLHLRLSRGFTTGSAVQRGSNVLTTPQ